MVFTLMLRDVLQSCRFTLRILHEELTIAMLQEIKSRRADVLQELGVLQNNVSVVLALMNNEEVMKKMENMRDSKALNNYLTQESDVSGIAISSTLDNRMI